jgi:hypothetical protein
MVTKLMRKVRVVVVRGLLRETTPVLNAEGPDRLVGAFGVGVRGFDY